MGTVFALGGGSFDDGTVFPIVKKIKDYTGKKNPDLLYLPTAGHDDISDKGVVFEGFERYGFTTSYLLLSDESLSDEYIRNTILSCDAVFAGGGNLKYLMDTWRKTKADIYLREAYEKGTVLSGSSSGAMCWFDRGWDDCGEDGSFMFVDCIGLLPFCNCPHFENGSWHNFVSEVRSCGMSGIASENGAAFVYHDGKYSVVNGTDGGSSYWFDKNNDYTQIKLAADAGILNN